MEVTPNLVFLIYSLLKYSLPISQIALKYRVRFIEMTLLAYFPSIMN